MENINEYSQYAPILIFVLMFAFKHKIFVAPQQLEKKQKGFYEDIEQNYVTRRDCDEHKKSTEKGLGELVSAVNDIRNYLFDIANKRK